MSLSVLFVCTANICRSPFMELVSRHAVGDAEIGFASAGTRGHDGEPMDPTMADQLVAAGVAVDGFSSRRLTSRMIDDADLVLTAERSHRGFVLDGHPAAFRKVLTLGQASSAARQLTADTPGHETLAHLARHRGQAVPEDDVTDPFRRGDEAAAACAATVLDMLSRVLPALTGSPVRLPPAPDTPET